MKGYKNREIHLNKPVKVYRNLHKKCWSVKQSGLVVGHTNYLILKDCIFTVNQNSRNKVIEQRKKNVHAFVIGYITLEAFNVGRQEFYYCPYSFDSFVDRNTKSRLDKVDYVKFSDKAYYVNLVQKTT